MPEWYLMQHPHGMSLWSFFGILGMYCFGYYLFSNANSQKRNFRTNPKSLVWGKPPKVIETANGKGLLISGWWGVARHINYSGDLIQAYAFGLPAFAVAV